LLECEKSTTMDEPSIAALFHHLSASRLVTIAQIEGRVRGAGSEFALACDMRYARARRRLPSRQ
jgi:enoyl-CoA hydratase/carnithine racemase